MPDDDETLELLELLNLSRGAPLVQRHRRWARAFEAWIEDRSSRYKCAVAQTSHLAWREFLDLTGKAPWQVSVEDVNAYIKALQAKGRRPNTISGRLAALSSFYEYCREVGVDAVCRTGFNPVKGAQRPKILEYEKARYLSEKEEAALLEAAQRDDRPISKRDYALILTMLRTGWKAGRVRGLRWEDLETERLGEGVTEEVRRAICDYLEAAGRGEGIGEEEYVFAPTTRHLITERRERAEEWDGGRPLGRKQVHTIVKQHARLAGLRAELISCHTLRHTAAMRRLKQGESLDEVGDYLGRKMKRKTRAYLRKLQKRPRARLKSRKRGLDPQQAPRRKQVRFQRGDQMRLTHGLRARSLPELEWLLEQGIRLDPLDAEVLRWRIVIKRATVLWEHIETVEEASLVLRAMSQASANLVRAIKRRKEMRAMAKELGLEEEMLEWWGEEGVTSEK